MDVFATYSRSLKFESSLTLDQAENAPNVGIFGSSAGLTEIDLTDGDGTQPQDDDCDEYFFTLTVRYRTSFETKNSFH